MCLAIPGQIIEVTGVDPLERMGRVKFGGIVKEVSLAYTPEAKMEDYVLVHVGFAFQFRGARLKISTGVSKLLLSPSAKYLCETP